MKKNWCNKIALFNALRIAVASAAIFLFAVIITMSFGNQNTSLNGNNLHIRMVGTAFIQGKVVTLLEDSRNGIEGFFEVGDEVAGYQIADISNDGVVLDGNGQEYYIKIFATVDIPVISSKNKYVSNAEEADSPKILSEKSEILTDFTYEIVRTKEELLKDEPQRKIAQMELDIPLKGNLSSGFGWRKHPMGGGKEFHKGWDICAKSGTPIRAAADGVVSLSRYYGDLGYTIFINHKGTYQTHYGHLSKLLVKKGQVVQKGEIIGLVGSTGMSTGPHLHFEIYKGKKLISPDVFFKSSDLK